jgi:hypothetical protein
MTGSVLNDMAETQHPYDHLTPLFKMKVDKPSRMHCVAYEVPQMKVKRRQSSPTAHPEGAGGGKGSIAPTHSRPRH